MRQKGLTIITEIKRGRKQQLRELLETIGNDIENNPIIPFHHFTSVHFMRWIILDEATVQGKNINAKVVLSTNYDGPLENHLKDLCNHAGRGIFKIYEHCIDSPETSDSESMIRYLKRHRQPIAAFYRGTSGRKVQQIRNEQKLWHSIQDYLDNQSSEDPVEIKNNIIGHLDQSNSFSWAFKRYSHEFTYRFGGLLLVIFGLFILTSLVMIGIYFTRTFMYVSIFLVLSLLSGWMMLRRKEKKDRNEFNRVRQDATRVAQLARKEDYKVQNQLTHLVEVKPGITRQITLRFVLWSINLLAKYLFNKGSLGGIQSIHYARWVLLDGGKRLLFFSNYDGSWESYLGEFVDRASVGLTAVWSNTRGFPPTRNLIREGARHSAEFKAWARKQQIPTQVWYSAYPTSSIKNINNNTEIRRGLLLQQNNRELQDFLQRL